MPTLTLWSGKSRPAVWSLFAFALLASVVRLPAAGVTLITHGLNSNIDDWVLAMAKTVPRYALFPGTNYTCYEIYFVSTNSHYVPAWRRLAGDVPSATDSGEIVVKLDWRQLADNSTSTYDVAALVGPRLMDPGFISELGGHALSELPLHLIGHSRGGSLVCQLSRVLGTNGVWVDHLTTLDPHPLNNDGFFDFPYTVDDAPARTWDNVLFHDNYYQELNSVFYGEPVPGAYIRRLTNLDGGYGGLAASHSDVHLWYHATLDWRVPADDTVAAIGAGVRQAWWTGAEVGGTNAGFYYSLIGGADRTSTNQPGTAGKSPRQGFNQRWDCGVGTTNNRTALVANSGAWPNPILFSLAGTNRMAQGETNRFRLRYQWAKPVTTNATLGIYLDDDLNPYNGNERLLQEWTLPGTTSNSVVLTNLSVAVVPGNSAPGLHAAYAKLTVAGNSRYLYAPEVLALFSSWQAPSLSIALGSATPVVITVTGVPGQRIELESASDLGVWTPVATNWLTTSRWTATDERGATKARFYRARVE